MSTHKIVLLGTNQDLNNWKSSPRSEIEPSDTINKLIHFSHLGKKIAMMAILKTVKRQVIIFVTLVFIHNNTWRTIKKWA